MMMVCNIIPKRSLAVRRDQLNILQEVGATSAYRAESITNIQGGKLAGQRGEADIEIDAEKLPLRASIYNEFLLCLNCQKAPKLLHIRFQIDVLRFCNIQYVA